MKVIVCGCNGHMGRMVIETAKKFEDITVVGGVDLSENREYGFPIFDSAEKITIKPDAIVDFSNPRALSSLLAYSKKAGVPVVICTTGLSEAQVEQIKSCAKEVPVFFSGNMSLGINVLIELVKKATEILKNEFDVEIIEKHHNRKIDAPSGTAFMIAEEISKKMGGGAQYTYDRHSQRKPRDKHEIGMHSVRGGNIVGEHEVIFAGANEVITISHHAQSREIFAEGALKAARFLIGKEPGLYNMNDMLQKRCQ